MNMKYLMEQRDNGLQEVENQESYQQKHDTLRTEINVKTLYRGMKFEHLKRHYCIQNTDNELQDLYKLVTYIFRIGMKSNQNRYADFKAITENTAKELFNNLKKVKNIDESFIDNFNSIEEEIIKISIRDYYLTFLHQFDSRETKESVKYISPLLSMTESKDMAYKFMDNKNAKGIILEYIIPNNQINTISTLPLNNQNPVVPLLERYNLPIHPLPCPDEKEYSVKYALFPEYISGFYFYKENSIEPEYFILNSFFDKKNEPFNGFTINQDNFDFLLQQTSYTHGIQLLDSDFSKHSQA